MVRFTVLFLILAAGFAQAKPSLVEITHGLGLSHKLEVELQGGVTRYDDEKLESIIKLMNAVLRKVRDFSPEDGAPHFFSSDPTGTFFPGRRFRLVLTDQQSVSVRGQKVSLHASMDAATLALIVPGDEELVAVVRLDRLVFDGRGGYQSLAYFKMMSAMISQIHGFWREHLSHSIDDLGSPAYAPKVLNPLVLKRTVDLLKSLLEDPRVISDRHAGGYLGEFYKRWILEQQQLAALRRQPPGPFVLPSVITWSPDTLSGMNPQLREASRQMVYRALHLVHSVKPAYLEDTVFRARTEKRAVLSGKDLKIMFLDTRERKGRDAFAFPVTVDGGHWCPSETIIVTAGHEQFFRTAFWTDHIFYNNQGADPDALANMTVALASELYGGIQRELYTRASDMKAQSVNEVLTYRQVVLRRGATFVDTLKANPLWGTLTHEEKASFNKVRVIYEREADSTKCLIDILKKSGEDKK